MFENRWRWVSWAVVCGVFSLLVWQWSSCMGLQHEYAKMKQHRAYTTMAKAEIQSTMDGMLDNGGMRFDPNQPYRFFLRDPRDLSKFCVDQFFDNPIKVFNMYTPNAPVWRRGPAGTELGAVYLETTRSPQGTVIITGVYRDPASKALRTWVEKVEHHQNFPLPGKADSASAAQQP